MSIIFNNIKQKSIIYIKRYIVGTTFCTLSLFGVNKYCNKLIENGNFDTAFFWSEKVVNFYSYNMLRYILFPVRPFTDYLFLNLCNVKLECMINKPILLPQDDYPGKEFWFPFEEFINSSYKNIQWYSKLNEKLGFKIRCIENILVPLRFEECRILSQSDNNKSRAISLSKKYMDIYSDKKYIKIYNSVDKNMFKLLYTYILSYTPPINNKQILNNICDSLIDIFELKKTNDLKNIINDIDNFIEHNHNVNINYINTLKRVGLCINKIIDIIYLKEFLEQSNRLFEKNYLNNQRYTVLQKSITLNIINKKVFIYEPITINDKEKIEDFRIFFNNNGDKGQESEALQILANIAFFEENYKEYADKSVQAANVSGYKYGYSIITYLLNAVDGFLYCDDKNNSIKYLHEAESILYKIVVKNNIVETDKQEKINIYKKIISLYDNENVENHELLLKVDEPYPVLIRWKTKNEVKCKIDSETKDEVKNKIDNEIKKETYCCIL
jgi:hypothetical protein